jgi:putative membrane protein
MRDRPIAVLALAAAALMLPSSAGAADEAERASFFVIDAIKADNGEIAVATLVRERAAAAEVRELAAMIVRDHAASREQAIAAGKTVGVGVPTAMSAEARHLQRKLARLTGAALDQAFLTATIKQHRKTIEKYAEQARSGDAVTRKLAEDALPRLREHLRIALSLQSGNAPAGA